MINNYMIHLIPSIPLPENYTEPTETPDNVLPNVTETITTPSSNLNITEFDSSTTTTTTTTTTSRPVAGNVTGADPETPHIQPERTTRAAVTSSDIKPESSQAEEKSGGGDDSLYGYKGEIVLICFTVLFVVLFVMMVVKYHRLKTKFGGYDVGPDTGAGRTNPSYNLQMSYRNGDE